MNEIDAPEHHLFEQPLHEGPSCGSTDFVPVERDAAVHLLCTQCTRCWVELGAIWRGPNPYAHSSTTSRVLRRGPPITQWSARTRPDETDQHTVWR
jgi:hypothetical protein